MTACGKGQARAGFKSFISAFNRGDRRHLDRLFAREPDFRWYSSPPPGQRSGTSSGNRKSLIGYFRWRHSERDRMHLTWLHISADDRLDYNNFYFSIGRRARGYNDGRWFRAPGKGAMFCSRGQPKIFVLSLGSD